MTTKSFVGRVEWDGSFVARSVTYDGYPAGVGAALAEVLASEWAGGQPLVVLAELAEFREWWSIGLGLEGPTRVGHPNQRPGEQYLALVTGRLGQSIGQHREHEWGYLFRGDELVVVKIGEWWRAPRYPVLQWASVSVDSIGLVDWEKLGRTGSRDEPGGSR